MLPNNSLLIKLNQLSDLNAEPGYHRDLSSKKNWVKTFAGTRDSFRSNSPQTNPDDFVEVNKNFTSDITHAGLISYVHYAWANEIGIQLRPDMIMNTIISRLADQILSNPKDYKYLFTDSESKVDIVTVGNLFDIEQIIEKVRSVIKNPEFLSVICDTEFESDVVNAKLARNIAFACAATPYFSYMSTMCGIPTLEVIGSESDWIKLYQSINKLINMGPDNTYNHHKQYITESANIISNIIYYCFGTKTTDFKQLYSSREEFFSDIFHYGENAQCGSGHDDTVVSGWLRVFYGGSLKYEPSKILGKYNAHTNYLCVRDIDTQKMYCQVVSLAYSILDSDRNILSPHYGIITYEITDESTYNRLAMINNEKVDHHGRKYTPLNNTQLKEIIAKGTYYNPACKHYNKIGTNVICDKCRETVTIAIGSGTNNDLCLKCAHEVSLLK